MTDEDCAVCGHDTPCQCAKPVRKVPELVVTRGDGVPLPDQKTAIRQFIRQALDDGDNSGAAAGVVREAIHSLSMDYSLTADERHAFSLVSYYAKADTLNRLRRLLKH